MALPHAPVLVLVVSHVALFKREDGMVAAHAAVLPWEPMRAALAKDDVSGHDILRVGFFRAETFAGAGRGFVGGAL